jgi:hypothetical protein
VYPFLQVAIVTCGYYRNWWYLWTCMLTTDLFGCAILADYYLLHCSYLSALISQSFLDIGSVSRILDSIMKLCLQFCWSIEQYETGANMFEIDHITEVMSHPILLAFSNQIRMCHCLAHRFMEVSLLSFLVYVPWTCLYLVIFRSSTRNQIRCTLS